MVVLASSALTGFAGPTAATRTAGKGDGKAPLFMLEGGPGQTQATPEVVLFAGRRAVAARLEMFAFPGRTHVQIAGANQCAGSIMTQFVFDPTATPHKRCIKKAPVVKFALPEDTGAPSQRN